jgi:GTP-binding protein YchF
MQIGLVGLQYSGKTTLFNTIAEIETEAASAGKEEANIEVVKIPDSRLDELTELFNPKKKINATIEVYDIPGLRMSDGGKVKITSEFLNAVRNNDALFYIVRKFEEASVAHPMNNINPVRDIQFLETEFLFSDMSLLENRIARIKKDLMKSADDKLKHELPVIEKCYDHVENELPLRSLKLDESELKLISGYQLLTLKPLIIGINMDESSIGTESSEVDSIKNELSSLNAEIIPFFAKIENELSKLDEEDKKMFMEDYGIKDSALSRILNSSYRSLGLQSFFTVGEDECRAWTIKKGYNAQQAAGVIHTDFYNKFIRAEVVHYNDFIKYKSFARCKEAGAWRLEGKDYLVEDGDIINVRHS